MDRELIEPETQKDVENRLDGIRWPHVEGMTRGQRGWFVEAVTILLNEAPEFHDIVFDLCAGISPRELCFRYGYEITDVGQIYVAALNFVRGYMNGDDVDLTTKPNYQDVKSVVAEWKITDAKSNCELMSKPFNQLTVDSDANSWAKYLRQLIADSGGTIPPTKKLTWVTAPKQPRKRLTYAERKQRPPREVTPSQPRTKMDPAEYVAKRRAYRAKLRLKKGMVPRTKLQLTPEEWRERKRLNGVAWRAKQKEKTLNSGEVTSGPVPS